MPPGISDASAQLNHVAGVLTANVPASSRLVVRAERNQLLLWIADDDGRSPVAATLADAGPGVHVAVGDRHAGIEGFRTSHATAIAARDFVSAFQPHPPSLTDYDRIAFPALLLADRAQARRFASRLLGGLADPELGELRATTLTFLRNGRSFARTATALLLHRNTVAYRVSRAEELIGRPLGEVAYEAHAALTILQVLRDVG